MTTDPTTDPRAQAKETVSDGLARCIGDPGSALPRHNQSAGEPYETVTRWATRAVLTWLTDPANRPAVLALLGEKGDLRAVVERVVARMGARNVDHRHDDEVGWMGVRGRAYFAASDVYQDFADLRDALTADRTQDSDAATMLVERLLAALRDTYTDEGVLTYLTGLAEKAEALAGGPPVGQEPTSDPGGDEGLRGLSLITAERLRQIEQEGWTPEHDAGHDSDALARAAACYVTPEPRGYLNTGTTPRLWPWRAEDWKPTPDDRVRELTKAGALIAAEIDRLLAPARPGTDGGGT